MELVVYIPDSVVASLPENGDLARELLESYAIEGYRSRRLTAYQIQEMLGFETGMEVDAFLKAHSVPLEMTLDDLDARRTALNVLLAR